MSCIGAASFRPTLKNNKQTSRDNTHAVYPYEHGEFVVLGPETFVTRDGQTVYWRGFAYRRIVPVFVDPLEIK